MRGGALIAWEMHPLFTPDGVITFTVSASRTGVGDWETVATVTDSNVAEDAIQRLYGKAPRLYYRVTATTENGDTYESRKRQITSSLNERDSRLVREIMRKENLNMQKYAGQCGYLYKRRRWGTPCPECLDYDTGEIKNKHCEVCYGTGFVGGYFEPVEYWVAPAVKGVTRRTSTSLAAQGVIEDRVWQARGINCPWLDTGDMWLDFDTDQRYFVQRVSEITFRKIPIIFDPIELRLAPVTDIVYSLVRPEDEESSSS